MIDKTERIEEVLALVQAKAPDNQRATLERFVNAYYEQVPPDDVIERRADDLYGAALSLWNYARKRTPGQPKVRVFNPNVEEHGWQSTHTVIEIVNDDMPFLVDSVTMEINRRGLTLHLIVHPIITVRRSDGELLGLGEAGGEGVLAESFMHVEVDRQIKPELLDELAADLLRVLGDVRVAVADWPKMLAQLGAVLEEIEQRKPPVAPDERLEGQAFLRWLAEDHFTFLGYRCYDLVQVDGQDALSIVPDSGLGILRERPDRPAAAQVSLLPDNQRDFARLPHLIFVTKANSRATVHRAAYLDYIGVKRFNEQGEVCGEHRFLGLFTSTAYSAEPEHIPLLRRKTANVIARSGIAPGSHAGKTLLDIIENYPRDELFQIGEVELLKTVMAIVHLGERPRLRLFVRRDPFDRFVSCLIYAPRENYNTDLRKRWQTILQQALNGTSTDYSALLSQSVLVRTLITVRTTPDQIPPFDVADLERRLANAARLWKDDLQDALCEALGEARGGVLFQRYQDAFPAAYCEDFAARHAVPDIERAERLLAGEAFGLSLYRPLEAAPGTLRFKLVHKGKPVALSDSLPMLECMGLRVLDERPYRLTLAGEETIWIHDFGLMNQRAELELEIEQLHEIFEDAFGRIFRGEIERDDFNRLVIAAGLPAEEIVILRAYAKYLRQIGFPLSQSFIEATLANHAILAQQLIALFKLRFDPAQAESYSEAAEAELVKEIRATLEHVQNLNEDRVLRQYLVLIRATTRTNFWRTDGVHGKRRSFLSFKFDPSKIKDLPEPKPMFEIFVYSPRFEGVHLRGGKVARGGLRWSDRPEDFRTEILGLVKAQMVKNTVIVPVGSKGGFVLKRPVSPADREAWMREGVECYQDYLRALLDLTDNRVQDRIVPPPQVRRHDPDDPYLVVAADKGTATFSDYANAISKEYGFWMDDAFASGGSAGYDHKGMGITARGTWESVKRHFRELGLNTQTTDFTVVGIGDMSGDVFGNGMLLSKHIRLLAAFDHRHIFLDPKPDAATSYAERERLFKLPRSSWADYNAALISPGGGVYPRSAKSIPISPEVKQALSIFTGQGADELTPAELIHALLKAPVDLLYNGGIGTYVKSTRETHAQVGDRANDAVRVNGNELRCKAVAEGGNLGCTQLGRVEYALNGGRINTDAIDNSAGVSTSDHEVNIKILLALVMAEGELTEKQRNALLAEMTDEVAALVLRDNYSQTQWLSVSGRQSFAQLDAQQRFIRFLEKQGRLKRALEFLPNDEELTERRAKQLGLTSPERAVLLAYSKIWLFDELLASPLPDDPWVMTALTRYFPKALRERYAAYMPKHPLRREIIATHVTNSMLNRVGGTFVHQLMETTGFSPAEIVRAYLLAREIFRVVPLWLEIEALDNQVSDEMQAELVIEVGSVLTRATAWFLRSRRLGEDMSATIAYFGQGIEALAEVLLSVLDPAERARIDQLVARYKAYGVPDSLALRVACRAPLYATLDIVEVAGASQQPVERVANVYFSLATKLDLPALREQIAALPGDQHWQALARNAMLDDLTGLQRTITGEVLNGYGAAADPATLVSLWQTHNQRALERTQQLLAELKNVAAMDASMLSVALRELRHLA